MTFFVPVTPPDLTPESILLDRCCNGLIKEFTNKNPGKKWDQMYKYFDQQYGIKVDPVYGFNTAHGHVEVNQLNLDLFKEKPVKEAIEESILKAAKAFESGDLDLAEKLLKAGVPGMEYTEVKKDKFEGLSITIPNVKDESAEFIRIFKSEADPIQLDINEVIARLQRFNQEDAYDLTHYIAQHLKSMLDRKVDDTVFHAETDRWLIAIMGAVTDPIDIARIMRVWLCEYNLPLQPTKMESFDYLHKNYGQMIMDISTNTGQEYRDANLTLNRYHSQQHKKRFTLEFGMHNVPTSATPHPIINSVLNGAYRNGVEYRSYKNEDGSIAYERIITKLTVWQAIKRWAQKLLTKNYKL